MQTLDVISQRAPRPGQSSPRTPPYVRVPPELWTVICYHACTDGGATGRALSLACRYLCAVSLASKHRSIALEGYEQIVRFAKLLRDVHTPEELRAVESLMVTFGKVYPGVEDEDRDDYKDLERRYAAIDPSRSAIGNILWLIAPTLTRLTGFLPSSHADSIAFHNALCARCLFNIPLPNLTEVALLNFHGTAGHGRFTFSKETHMFAAVRRLHIAHNSDAAMLFVRSGMFPGLTHLRISSPSIRYGYRIYWGPFFNALSPKRTKKFPVAHSNMMSLRQLNTIIIETRPGVHKAYNEKHRYNRSCWKLQERRLKSGTSMLPNLRVLHDWRTEGIDLDCAFTAQWLDRNAGGAGCWNEDFVTDWDEDYSSESSEEDNSSYDESPQ